MLYFLDLLGTMAFAIGGAYKAKSRELNIFGAVFVGMITAIGGGTIRDLIIGRTPLFYLQDQNYLIVAITASIITFFLPNFFKKAYSIFRFTDSIGIAAFAIIGTSVTYSHLFGQSASLTILPSLVSIALGVLTAVGGGIFRDALMGDVPYAIKHGSNYITSALVGAVLYFVISFENQIGAAVVSIIVVLLLREVFSSYGLYQKVILNGLKNRKVKHKK